jgi:hypothetical protein
VVALNRAMAIAQHQGPREGLAAISGIAGVQRLARYPFYEAALAEVSLRVGQPEVARQHFRAAHALARNDGERRFLAAHRRAESRPPLGQTRPALRARRQSEEDGRATSRRTTSSPGGPRLPLETSKSRRGLAPSFRS